MPKFDLTLKTEPTESFRSQRVAGMFDIDPSEKHLEKHWHVDMPFEEMEWNVGLIVGSSGSGKTSIAKKAFGSQYKEPFDWDERSIVDNFPKEMSVDAIIEHLSQVGLSSPPAWLKPYHVLSNGEKFRAEMARHLAETPTEEISVCDEFTSLVDRQVARVASYAIAKGVRRNNRKFVAVSCHSDIAEWLEPDWIYEAETGSFRRGSLRRPKINLTISRRNSKIWNLFAEHHYLSKVIHPSAHCWVASYEDRPVAICAMWKFNHPHKNMANMWKISRIVVLPEFQGLGIGCKLADTIAQKYIDEGLRVRLTSSHPVLHKHAVNSDNWVIVRRPGRVPPSGKSGAKTATGSSSTRITASYEYVSSKGK